MRPAIHWIFRVASVVVGVVAVLCFGPATYAQDVPNYKPDVTWPKPLPNNWALGQIGAITVDKQDHIWVLHRPTTVGPRKSDAAPAANAPIAAPPVLEFDATGTLLKSWGAPEYVPDWPVQEHGIFVDRDGNVWIGGNGPGGKGTTDRAVLEFTNDGKLIKEIGKRSTDPPDNADTTVLGGPAGIDIDEAAHEVYISDGYLNKRVVVFDSITGAFKRGWGAYGIPLDQIDNAPLPAYDPSAPPAKQFGRPVHCVHLSVDGLVYVCDRSGDRFQVFTKQGKFVKEFLIHPEARGQGSVGTLNFSTDAKQKYLLIGDMEDNTVWIVGRNDGAIAGSFGGKGTGSGQFDGLHAMATDSHGNVYLGDTNGKRIQKFVAGAAK